MSNSSGKNLLTITVEAPGAARQEAFFVQQGVSIGRNPDETICLDDPQVDRLHAKVRRQPDGAMLLECVGPQAVITLPDGQTTRSVVLESGVAFRIGAATLRCQNASSRGTVDSASDVWHRRCPKCHADLSGEARAQTCCPVCAAQIFYQPNDGRFEGWLPAQVGPYTVRAFCARGGMGIVLRGLHEKEDLLAAVKLMDGDDDIAARKRFEEEVRLLQAVVHPHLVRLQDHGADNQLRWLAMDWIQGETLAQIIAARNAASQSLPLQTAAAWLRQIVAGLGHLHDKSIVHRDLKPGNILVGKDDLLKVADFGLAKAPGGAAGATTRTGTVAGTLVYLAPELIHGGPATPASDIFSLGVVWYEMLAGHRPTRPYRPVTAERPDVSAAWAEMIGRCLADDPAVRPSCHEVAAVLEASVESEAAVKKPQKSATERIEQIRKMLAPWQEYLKALGSALFVCFVLGWRFLCGNWPGACFIADYYINRGIDYGAKKEYDKAIANYDTAVWYDPMYPRAYICRGLAYDETKEYDKALADYTEAIRLDRNYAPTYLNRGNAYLNKKEYDKALADYGEAIRLDPNYALAYSNRGIAFLEKKDYDKAIADCSEAIRLDPNFAPSYRSRGNAYLDKKDYDKALADYGEVIRLDPKLANAYEGRGIAYGDKKEYDKAIADYTEAIRLDPNNAPAYLSRAFAYGNVNEPAKEIADYTEAIRLDPKNALAYHNRAICYRDKGEKGKADADFARAKALKADVIVEPMSPPAKPITNSLGMTLIYCPSGTFTMGSGTNEKDREKDEDQVSVTISKGFYLGKYSVTQAEYKTVMEATPWAGEKQVKEGDDYPAIYVDWDEAAEFCRRLTARESPTGRLPTGYVYALPTEAQREYACRAGTTTAYSFGSDPSHLDDCAWYDKHPYYVGEMYAHRVGQKKPNPWGFCDLHGNVWEWCRDYYAENLPGGTDPMVETGSNRVNRGGCWLYRAGRCRSAARYCNGPGARLSVLGFRVALVPAEK